MKLIIAKSAGFCFGVKRAMDMALEAAKKYPKDLYTLGPLIHNPQAVEFLEELGVKAKRPDRTYPQRDGDLPIPWGLFERFEEGEREEVAYHRCNLSHCQKGQLFAKYLHRHGYALLIVGDAHHPEVEAIRSYIQEGVDVVEDVEGSSAIRSMGEIRNYCPNHPIFQPF